MKNLSFFKYQAQGNHFILIDDQSLAFPTDDRELIERLCHPCFGVGADGLILIQPSNVCNVRMRIFNSDGCEAESCGNGVFCVTQLWSDLGFSEAKISIELKKSSAFVRFIDQKLALNLGAYKDLYLHQSIYIEGKKIDFHKINTGVPHAVIFAENIEDLNVETLGKSIKEHEYFQPEGTNVNFVSIGPQNTISVRTYERGVEKETYACGTGAWAVALITSFFHSLEPSFTIKHPGGSYEIRMDQGVQSLEIIGSACKVFTGSLDFDLS